MNVTIITRPTVEDVSNINEMVAFLAIEVNDAQTRQEVLFTKALSAHCNFKRSELMNQVESLQVMEISLKKYLSSVHYQALEQSDESAFVIPFPKVA